MYKVFQLYMNTGTCSCWTSPSFCLSCDCRLSIRVAAPFCLKLSYKLVRLPLEEAKVRDFSRISSYKRLNTRYRMCIWTFPCPIFNNPYDTRGYQYCSKSKSAWYLSQIFDKKVYNSMWSPTGHEEKIEWPS